MQLSSISLSLTRYSNRFIDWWTTWGSGPSLDLRFGGFPDTAALDLDFTGYTPTESLDLNFAANNYSAWEPNSNGIAGIYQTLIANADGIPGDYQVRTA